MQQIAKLQRIDITRKKSRGVVLRSLNSIKNRYINPLIIYAKIELTKPKYDVLYNSSEKLSQQKSSFL